MVSPLEALDSRLETGTREALGDTISFKPSGGSASDILAIVDYGDEAERIVGSNVIRGDCAVELPLSISPDRPNGSEFVLPRRPGETFVPKDIKLDDSGMNWLVILKRKP